MKEIPIQAIDKQGNKKSATLLYPESVSELVAMEGERFVYKAAMTQYISRARRRLASNAKPRRKLLTLDLKSLNNDQLAGLKGLGFIQEE